MVLAILIVIAVIILWLLLSPLFTKIGQAVINLFTSITTEEIDNKNKEEKEKE
ncbi:hypothetical protein [uncultured Eubacterium sp.]|uniref:hypothetical protein n=1 Tax=uncultured Eubacterium sp. TaxID=165185 RepID=UPI00259578AC|nr:hypothetical protein [uncultured Eubacterium sp.]